MSNDLEALTEEELDVLRAYRESEEPPDPTDELEHIQEEEFEALTNEQIRNITNDQIFKKISHESSELIIEFEVSSEKLYNRKYQSPIWPGHVSGMTIGIGYDLGHQTPSMFEAEWKPELSENDFQRLSKLVGFKTSPPSQDKIRQAKIYESEHSDIKIDFAIAKKVFHQHTLAIYARRALRIFPGMIDLPPDCFGALVSLVFNRGASLKGQRRREVRNIRDHLLNNETNKIPDEFRSMKRLWAKKKLTGLLKRREREARLFEKGLSSLKTLDITKTNTSPAVISEPILEPTTKVLDNKHQSHKTELKTIPHDNKTDAYEEPISPFFPESFQNWPVVEDKTFEPELEEEGDGAFWDADFDRDEDFERYNPNDELFESNRRKWSGVHWVSNDMLSSEYNHIKNKELKSCVFEFTVNDLEQLIFTNHFDPIKQENRIIFGLRGAELIAQSDSPKDRFHQIDRQFLTLRETRPDHEHFKCTIGVYNLETKLLSAFRASTVPNRMAVYGYATGTGSPCNLLPAGCYHYRVGYHRKKPGCLIEASKFTVLRNIKHSSNKEKLAFDHQDIWDNAWPADNLHPAAANKSAEFSSWGCLTIRGFYRRSSDTHTGEWGLFRKALGLKPHGNSDHNKSFSVVLLTGLEAAIAAKLRKDNLQNDGNQLQEQLIRFRHGSRGELVAKLQEKLRIKTDGIFGPQLKKRLTEIQKHKLGWADGIFSKAMDKQLEFDLFAPPKVIISNSAKIDEQDLQHASQIIDIEKEQQLESLFFELGVRSQAARKNQENIWDKDVIQQVEHLEGPFVDEFIARGKRIFQRIETSFHSLLCGDNSIDSSERKELQNSIFNAIPIGEDALINVISSWISSLFLIPKLIADQISKIIVRRVFKPVLDEAGEVISLKMDMTCRIWAKSLRDEQIKQEQIT